MTPRKAAVLALAPLSVALMLGQNPPNGQVMAEKAFKNVTVLKGIPVDEFMNTMGFISAATNYNCIDCHKEGRVEGDWGVYAEETPRKITARRMIQMVQDLNKNSFNGARVVTCYTCRSEEHTSELQSH